MALVRDRCFLGKAARSLMHDTPVFPGLGNHEYFYSGRSWFSSLFSLPHDEQWFPFTYGNVRFIGLDMNGSFSRTIQ